MILPIVDVNEDKMKAVADEVRAVGRKATTFKADVTKRDDVYAAVNRAEKDLGGFDIMVNNAGIAQVQPLADVTLIGTNPAFGSGYSATVKLPNRNSALACRITSAAPCMASVAMIAATMMSGHPVPVPKTLSAASKTARMPSTSLRVQIHAERIMASP